MISFSIIALCLLSLLTLVTVSFGIGRALSAGSGWPMDPVADILKGLLLIVSIYAIIKTEAHTILLPIPFLVLLHIFLKKQLDRPGAPLRTYLWLFLLAFLFYSCFFLFAFISFEPGMVRLPTGDNAFYARLAEFLNDKGVENYRFDHGSTDSAVMPYHYFDCWATALVSKIFELNTHYVLMLVVYPLFSLLFVLVVFGWLRKENRPDWKTGIVALLTPLFAGIGFLYPSRWVNAEVLNQAPVEIVKLLCPAVLFVWMLSYLRYNDISRVLIVSAIIGLCYATLLPALALLTGWILFQSFRQGRIKFLIPALIGAIISAGYFIWFYRNSGYSQVRFQFTAMEYIGRSLKMMAGGMMEIIIWLPIMVLGWLIFREQKFLQVRELKAILIFVLGGLLGWIFCWTIHVEYQQLFESAFVLGSALLTALVFVNAFESFKWLVYVPVFGLIIFFIVRNPRYNYHVEELRSADLQKAKDFLKRNGPGNFASYRCKKEYTSYYSMLTQTYPALAWLGYLREPYESFSLDTWELREDLKKRHNMGHAVDVLDHAPYTSFAREHQYLTGIECGRVFMESRGIRYLQISPLVQIAFPGIYIKDSIQLSGGWRIYSF
ncbi:MAG: hypothetical protein IPQ08_11885 [Chitinophagaceae bacterium]|nr:hypothetical protein [Chitinophagaceae bacterium]